MSIKIKKIVKYDTSEVYKSLVVTSFFIISASINNKTFNYDFIYITPMLSDNKDIFKENLKKLSLMCDSQEKITAYNNKNNFQEVFEIFNIKRNNHNNHFIFLNNKKTPKGNLFFKIFFQYLTVNFYKLFNKKVKNVLISKKLLNSLDYSKMGIWLDKTKRLKINQKFYLHIKQKHIKAEYFLKAEYNQKIKEYLDKKYSFIDYDNFKKNNDKDTIKNYYKELTEQQSNYCNIFNTHYFNETELNKNNIFLFLPYMFSIFQKIAIINKVFEINLTKKNIMEEDFSNIIFKGNNKEKFNIIRELKSIKLTIEQKENKNKYY